MLNKTEPLLDMPKGLIMMIVRIAPVWYPEIERLADG